MQELRGEEVTEDILPGIDLPIAAHIPDDYIPGEAERIYFYKRLSGVRSVREIEELQAELEDRFGDPPRAVWDAMAVLRLRLRCKDAGIASVKMDAPNVRIQFAPQTKLTPEAVRLLTFAFKGLKFTNDGVIVPLVGPKILPQVEEILSSLEKALASGKTKKNGNGNGSSGTVKPRLTPAAPARA